MKKIILGLFSILLVISAATASGYAVFSASANVSNASFTTGTAGLQFSTDDTTWTGSYSFPDAFATNVYPGYSTTSSFWLNNTSTAPINLGITSQLVSATGDWGTLASVAHVVVNGVDHTLQDWNTSAQDIGLSLAPNTPTQVTVTFYIPTSAGNEIAGKSLSTNWVITGTQQ